MPSGDPLSPTKVSEGVYRGPSPEGVPDWAILSNLGIKYCLDLQTGSAILMDGSPLRESLMAEGYDIKSYAHPLGWIFPPTKDELNDAGKFIRDHQPVYVHCKSGVDRTGMVCAYYELYGPNVTSRDEVIAEMFRHGMHFWFRWWSLFL